jgi:hypothetical protein
MAEELKAGLGAGKMREFISLHGPLLSHSTK